MKNNLTSSSVSKARSTFAALGAMRPLKIQRNKRRKERNSEKLTVWTAQFSLFICKREDEKKNRISNQHVDTIQTIIYSLFIQIRLSKNSKNVQQANDEKARKTKTERKINDQSRKINEEKSEKKQQRP